MTKIAGKGEAGGVLRELRAHHGGPNAGTRFVALVLVLLLAAPLTYFLFRAAQWVLGLLT